MTEQRNTLASTALITLATLAVLYTLHVARDVLLPITLALIFALMLQPALLWLVSWRVPKPAASLLLIAGLLSLLLSVGWFLSSSAMDWAHRLPEAEGVIAHLTSSVQEEVLEMDLATRQVVELTEEIALSEASDAQKVVIAKPGWRVELWLLMRDIIFYSGLSVILLFFLLSSSEELIQRVISCLPSREGKHLLLRAAVRAQEQMSRYLITVASVNLLVGVVTASALWMADFPDPALWGAVAATLRFIPYMGASLTAGLLGLVAAISFDNPMLVAGTVSGYLVFAAVVGQLIDPLVHGSSLGLNPIVVFLWIFFWGWLWGAPGVLLAVPLLALFQVLCQYTPGLEIISTVIGKSHSAQPGIAPSE